MWTSSRTRYKVVTPSGGSVTYSRREDAVRHAAIHNGTVTEIKPGQRA